MPYFNYSQIGLAGVFNSAANTARGLTRVTVPLLGNYDGMVGGFLQGAISNVLYQIVLPFVGLDLLAVDAYVLAEGYTTVSDELSKVQAPLMLGGAGAISQVVTTRVLSDNRSGALMDSVQGALIHPASQYAATSLKLK